VFFSEVIRPVRPIILNEQQKERFEQAMNLFRSRLFSSAAKSFLALSALFSSNDSKSRASACAMTSNSFKMKARRFKGNARLVRVFMDEALKHLDESLKHEPYWAEYLESRVKLRDFIHQNFGCRASFDGKVWTTGCYKVSRALRLPGISPGLTQRFECSICGKDPVLCEHVPGKTYEGRLALMVAKDIRVDHVAIVYEPMQLETYILPRSLTPRMLRRILPLKMAENIISHPDTLTCRDLLKAIREHRLRGIYWQPER